MKTLQNFLNRYKNIKAPERTKQKVFIDAVKKYVDVTLNKTDFKIHKDSISLRAPSVIRSEIKFKENDILKYLEENLGEKFVSIR